MENASHRLRRPFSVIRKEREEFVAAYKEILAAPEPEGFAEYLQWANCRARVKEFEKELGEATEREDAVSLN